MLNSDAQARGEAVLVEAIVRPRAGKRDPSFILDLGKTRLGFDALRRGHRLSIERVSGHEREI